MFRKKTFVTLLLSFLLSYGANADIGIGISIQDGDNSIYIPYMVSESIIVEASLLYADSESDIGNSNVDIERYELGIGVFKKNDLRDKLFLYLGGRVSYIEEESTSLIALPVGVISAFPTSSKFTSDGYRIAPTIGVAYEVTDGFSIAAEAEWHYTDLDVESTGVSSFDGDTTSTGTETRVVFRYIF